MGSRKGKNNFRPFQEERTSAVVTELESILSSTGKGVVFRNRSSIVNYLAQQENIGLHRTTLRRNPRYWRIILKFFTEQRGAAQLIEVAEMTEAMTRVNDLAKSAEIQNLKNDVRRLKARLAKQDGDAGGSAIPCADEPAETKRSGSPTDIPFATTAKALLLLIAALEEREVGIKLDSKTGDIIDALDLDGPKILVPADQLRDFLDWTSSAAATALSNANDS